MPFNNFLNVYALLLQESENTIGLLIFLIQMARLRPLAPQNTRNVRITFSYQPIYVGW